MYFFNGALIRIKKDLMCMINYFEFIIFKLFFLFSFFFSDYLILTQSFGKRNLFLAFIFLISMIPYLKDVLKANSSFSYRSIIPNPLIRRCIKRYFIIRSIDRVTQILRLRPLAF